MVIWHLAVRGGEYVCAGCGRPVEEIDGGPGVGIIHTDDCPEVSRTAGGAA